MLFASFYAPLRYICFNIWNFVVFPVLMNKYNYTLQLKKYSSYEYIDMAQYFK